MKTIFRIYQYDVYLKEFFILFFCYLLVEPCFSWIFIQNSSITNTYVKVLSLLIYAFTLISFKDFKTPEKVYIGLFTFFMVKAAFQSLSLYGSVFQYFEVYVVLFPVIFVVFIKWLLEKLNLDLLEFIAKFYLVMYAIFMVMFGRGFSLGLSDIEMSDYGPFSGDTRIMHAQSVFMIIIPFLWYLNRYILTKQRKFLWWLLLCFMIILLHQHRSVWTGTIVATAIYFMAIIRNHPRAITGTFKFFVITGVVVGLTLVVVSSLYPELIDYFVQRFSEILAPGEQEGTASFRINQSVTYYEFVKQRPLFGWTFEGFEMENPLVDWWPEKTGQHFHEGYIEILFYHGYLGAILKYSFMLFILVKAFTKNLSDKAVILCAYVISGFVFSLSYVLPLIFWGHVGMCLYYLENNDASIFRLRARSPIIKTDYPE